MICSRTFRSVAENWLSVSNCHLEHVENGDNTAAAPTTLYREGTD